MCCKQYGTLIFFPVIKYTTNNASSVLWYSFHIYFSKHWQVLLKSFTFRCQDLFSTYSLFSRVTELYLIILDMVCFGVLLFCWVGFFYISWRRNVFFDNWRHHTVTNIHIMHALVYVSLLVTVTLLIYLPEEKNQELIRCGNTVKQCWSVLEDLPWGEGRGD